MSQENAQHVVVIGGGVIGASVAYHAQSAGAQVTLIDAGASRASDASFGWINASFFRDDAHFRLRQESIASYRQLAKALDLPISWQGALSWEWQGAELDDMTARFAALAYPAKVITAAEFAKLEPNVEARPERAIFIRQEGAAETAQLANRLRQAAQAEGALILSGAPVLEVAPGTPAKLRTRLGWLEADRIVIAAGVKSTELVSSFGGHLPQRSSPALMLRTRPVAPILSHVLVSEQGEIRQQPDGSILLPWDIHHQDTDTDLDALDLRNLGAETMARLQRLLPSVAFEIAEITLAHRPMPEDGLPVVGEVADNTHVAVMHSGITLAAVVGELVAEEVLQGVTNRSQSLLHPYRPTRFGS